MDIFHYKTTSVADAKNSLVNASCDLEKQFTYDVSQSDFVYKDVNVSGAFEDFTKTVNVFAGLLRDGSHTVSTVLNDLTKNLDDFEQKSSFKARSNAAEAV